MSRVLIMICASENYCCLFFFVSQIEFCCLSIKFNGLLTDLIVISCVLLCTTNDLNTWHRRTAGAYWSERRAQQRRVCSTKHKTKN
jgi:hypothetical protein